MLSEEQRLQARLLVQVVLQQPARVAVHRTHRTAGGSGGLHSLLVRYDTAADRWQSRSRGQMNWYSGTPGTVVPWTVVRSVRSGSVRVPVSEFRSSEVLC